MISGSTNLLALRNRTARTSVLVQKLVVSRTGFPDFRLGVWRAVMLKHHKGRTTMTESPQSPTCGSLVPSSGGRQNRLTMLWHRLRVPSYPEDGTSDPRCHELLNQVTRLLE